MKECRTCDFYNDGACYCPSYDKWFACPIEERKPENQKALKEWAEQLERQKGEKPNDF